MSIDDQFERGRLLGAREIARARALEDPVSQGGRAPVVFFHARPIGHQAAVPRLHRKGVDGRKTVGEREFGDVLAIPEHSVFGDEEHGLRSGSGGIAKGRRQILHALEFA